MKHVKHVKCILPADWYIKQISNYSAFGRKTTLRMNPDKILDLHWSLADNYIDVDTLSYARGDRYREWCGTTLKMNVSVLQSNREPIVYHVINSNEDNYEN